MADFALLLAAADKVTEARGLERYLAKQGELAADSLTDDAFIQAVEKVGNFEGASSDLLSLVAKPEKPPKGWPINARGVTQLLRRQAPVMRKAGWDIEDDGARNHRNTALWTIRPPNIRERANSSSQSSPTSRPIDLPQQSSRESPAREARDGGDFLAIPQSSPASSRSAKAKLSSNINARGELGEYASLARVKPGPSLHGHTCERCGKAGEDIGEYEIEGETVRAHIACLRNDEWNAVVRATRADELPDIPEFLRRG
jgi:hypothetical protein